MSLAMSSGMEKLFLQHDGSLVGLDFASLLSLPEQDERPSRSFGGMVLGSVRLRTLLGDRVSRYFTFHSFDGYCTSLPWAAVDHCAIAYRLDRIPLPGRLGGPFRLVMLGAHPHSSLKHVEMIELGDQPRPEVMPRCVHDSAAHYLGL
jgi:DMSO/TMAO reductase YedYZ molybdopterin-dependent catalytic subunit